MTWLSEIEDINREVREDMRTPDNVETRTERMARVIRELVGYIQKVEYNSDALGCAYISCARDDLPEDVKEIIDENRIG